MSSYETRIAHRDVPDSTSPHLDSVALRAKRIKEAEQLWRRPLAGAHRDDDLPVRPEEEALRHAVSGLGPDGKPISSRERMMRAQENAWRSPTVGATAPQKSATPTGAGAKIGSTREDTGTLSSEEIRARRITASENAWRFPLSVGVHR